MSKRILAVQLKKKYKHPRRACDATGADVPWEYCVGGALCMEVMGEKAMHFPDYPRLQEAVLRAAPQIDRNLMSDSEYAAFHSKLNEVEDRNDVGDFDGAWRVLEELLNWPGTTFAKYEARERSGK
jgi:hypothetical protein